MAMSAGVAGILAGGSALGSMINSALSYKANKNLIRFQQDWQERMSNTAHQREVKDLEAAGLNPVLSANSGASWSGASASSMDIDAGIGTGIDKFMAYKQQNSQIANTDADTHVKEASWSLINEQDKNAYEQGLNLLEERKQIIANTAKSIAEIDNMNRYYDALIANLGSNTARNYADVDYVLSRTKGIKYGLTKAALESEYLSNQIGRTAYFAGQLGNSAASFLKPLSSFVPGTYRSDQRYYDNSHQYIHNGDY